MPDDVAEHERRRFEPGNPAQRGQIGLQPEVAVALLPARDPVPGHGIHLHVERQQVVAALDAVPAACSSTKNSPWRRLPMSRPCMSVNATITVSIEPSATAFVSSSSVSMDRESTRLPEA